MRELQATKFILDKVLLKARESNANHIKHLHLRLGEISELNQNSIQANWKELSKGTPAERAQLHFRRISAEVQCMSCFQKYHPKEGEVVCPHCGSVGAKIIAGEEFYMEAVDVE